MLGREKPAVENYRKALERLYPGKADEVFKLYPASNETEVMDSAQDLASDRFISYSTWKWVDVATKTGAKPTYYYLLRPSASCDAAGDGRRPAGSRRRRRARAAGGGQSAASAARRGSLGGDRIRDG